jgi:hypothetical protein
MDNRLTSSYQIVLIVRKYLCKRIKVSVNLILYQMIVVKIYLHLIVRTKVNLKIRIKFKMEVTLLSGHVHHRLIVQKWTVLKLKFQKIMICSILYKLMIRNWKCKFLFKFRIKKWINHKFNNHFAPKGPIWLKIPAWLKKPK